MGKMHYYNAQEAMRKLGISKSTFYYYVEEGRIHKYLPPHKKRGAFFLATEIDEMAHSQQSLRSSPHGKQRTVFRAARSEDAEEIYALADHARTAMKYTGLVAERGFTYLDNSHPNIEPIMPDMEVGHILEGDRHIVGFFSILPLKYETLIRLIKKEVKIDEIKLEDLARYEPEEHVHCLIWKVEVDDDNKHIAAHLINKMLTFFHTLGKRGVEVEGVYAIATSRQEMNLCRRAGFSQIDMPGVTGSDWMPFELKIGPQKNRFTKNYLQARRSYKRRKYAENAH